MVKRLLALALGAALSVSSAPAAHAQMTPQPQVRLPAIGAPAGSGELSPSDEREIGERSMLQLKESPYYLDDPDTLEYLNRIGYRLVAQAPSCPYSFLFFPLAVPEINAFAMPGGFIAVFSGTIAAAQSEDELAGVMAHEIAHVTQRHIARMFESQKDTVAQMLGTVLLAILAGAAGGSSGGEAASAIMVGGQAAMISGQLKFSRSAEREADRIGFQTMARAGYDPQGMVSFFRRLQAKNGTYESGAAAYVSDHPLTVERIADMENRSHDFASPKMRRDGFDFRLMQARVLALQGRKQAAWTSAREQFEDRLSKNPLGAAAAVQHYGLSVVAREEGKYAEALAEAEKAVSLAGRNDLFLQNNLLHIRFLAAPASGKTPALDALKKLSEQNPQSLMVARTCIEDLYRAGLNADLIRFLKNQTALTDQSADYYRYLARSEEALGHRSASFQAAGRMYALQGEWKLAVYQFHQAQRISDGDFFTMSEIDADLRNAEARLKEIKDNG